MIILNCEQQSPEWFDARLRVASASNFGKIITPTGKPSTQAKTYFKKLFNEGISRKRKESFQSQEMLHGIEMEGEARNYYEFMFCPAEVKMQKVGLCYLDERKLISCSPDSLVGEDGGLEIKCPDPSTHDEYLDAGKVPSVYIPQIQGSLWVTGRQWWDFMSYVPGMPDFVLRVERDESYIDRLAVMVEDFVAKLDARLKPYLEMRKAG